MNEDIKKELQEISPFLANLKKKEDKSLPVDYFKKMQDDVIDQLDLQVEPIIKKTSWFDNLLHQLFAPKMAMAFGVFILAIAGMWVFMNPSITESNYNTLAMNVSDQEIGDYISQNIDDFTLETLQDVDVDLTVSFDELELSDEHYDELIDELSIETIESMESIL